MAERKIIYKNRKAYFNFDIQKTYTAGLMLRGGEIKSIRRGDVSIKEAYCYFEEDGLYVKNMYVKKYASLKSGAKDLNPYRNRKLLVRKEEQERLRKHIEQKGFSIVPVELFISNNGKAKLEIAIAKGKKTYDKRNSLKEKDAAREKNRTYEQ